MLRAHRTTKGNNAIVHEVRGPDINIKALDVLWTLQHDHLEGRGEKPGGLQNLILDVFLLGAEKGGEMRAALKTSTLRVAGARIPGWRRRIPR